MCWRARCCACRDPAVREEREIWLLGVWDRSVVDALLGLPLSSRESARLRCPRNDCSERPRDIGKGCQVEPGGPRPLGTAMRD